MRKTYKTLIAGAALSAVLAFSASAADVSFTNCADALKDMGLFKGTQVGYELDRAPTRGEAAAMLVRLLGGETEALEKNYATPFTDVPEWAKPYVGWLYENKLTNGTSDTTYGTQLNCTAQMYSTFLMRTLGYSDTGANADFTYKNALDFAEEKGVVDAANCDEDNFLRDHVAAMSYTALATETKDTKYDNLLDKLVKDGVVDAQKAKPVQNTFDVFDEYQQLVEKNASITDMEMNLKMDMDAKLNDVSVMSMNMDSNIKAKMNMQQLDKSKFSVEGNTKIKISGALTGQDKETSTDTEMKAYYTDGVYYVNTAGQKIKMPMSFDEIMQSMDIDVTTKTEPISTIKSISKAANGSYNISYSDSYLNGMMSSILGAMGETAQTGVMTFDKVDFVVTPQNGNIKTMKADMACTLKDSATNQTLKLEIGADYDIVKTGSSVVITLPTDLNTYVDASSITA